MRVVSSRLFRNVGVCGGGGCVGCGHGGYWVRLVYLRIGYGIVGCRIEAMCGWGWISRFALEDAEVVGVWPLYEGLTCFSSEVGCAGC